MAGILSSIGPVLLSKPHAPRSSARLYALPASATRNAIAQIDGPCKRAKRCAKESGSAFTRKLISPCLYSVTSLCRCRAIAVNPICSNSCPSATGSGAVYSMNSKPSVPTGLSQVVGCMLCLRNSRLIGQSLSRGDWRILANQIALDYDDACLQRQSVQRRQKMAQIELDAIDRKILAILQVNGRLSNQDIADQVSLSPSPCLRRIRRLEEAGVIRGYVALLEPRLLGLGLLAYVNVRLGKS